MSSVSSRALAAIPTPHAAVLDYLSAGPATVQKLAAAVRLPVGPIRVAVRDLHHEGRLFRRGDLVALASYYCRESDGLHLAVVHCAGRATQRRHASPPADDSGDAA